MFDVVLKEMGWGFFHGFFIFWSGVGGFGVWCWGGDGGEGLGVWE